MSALVARLRERKLVQWALAYLAGAWLALQLLGLLRDQMGWPAATFRIGLVLLAVGFLATLVLAWYHGERGAQRVSGPELVMIGGILVIAGTAVALVRGRGEPAAVAAGAPGEAVASTEQASLVVLPFADLSPGGDQEYFSDGMTEEILNALAHVPGLRVPGRTTSFSFKGQNLAVAEIGKQLGVAHVLEGSVRKDGDKLRITAQLIDARTDTHLWSETYDRQLADVFAIQEEISRAIVDQLQLRLMGAQQAALAKRPTEDLEAYNLYLQGRSFYNRRVGDNLATAIAYFERAVARDPKFAVAWGALAASHALYPIFNAVPPAEHVRATKENAAKALALDSTVAEAHRSLGYALTASAEDFPAAEREYEKALALDPSSATSHSWHCLHLEWQGRNEEALRECERAVELDPRDAVIQVVFGGLLAILHRYDEAEAAARRSLELDPGYTNSRTSLINIYVASGRPQQAVDEAELLLSLPGRPGSGTLAAAGSAFATAGDTARARGMLRQLEGRAAAGEYGLPNPTAQLYGALGEQDRALALLDDMVARKAVYSAGGFSQPQWDPIRSDPRFQRILTRLGVPASPSAR